MDKKKEIEEAVIASDKALDCLTEAAEQLRVAGKWGIFDMLGGGALTTLIKHARISDANSYLQKAKQAVKNLSKELADVDQVLDINIDISSFLNFSDYFFDGLIVDWMVQDKIRAAEKQVNEAIERVEEIKAGLLKM